VVALKTWIEVSEERLTGNFRTLAAAAGPDTAVLAVVKANAYGHGAELCSPVLAKAGAAWLGVTCVKEGARVRMALEMAGFARGAEPTPEILVMCGFLPDDVPAFKEYGLTPVIWTAEQIGWLRAVAPIRVHVEVDTGMGRQGVAGRRPLRELLGKLEAAGLVLDGIFTHFSGSEVARSQQTQIQQQLFDVAIAEVRAKGLTPAWVHAGNTSTVDNPAQKWPWLVKLAKSVGARAMVRSGIGLYGYCLPIEGADASSVEPKVRPTLKPVLTWKTRVLAVRDLAAGETVGYGAAFTATTPMRVALLPVGYADGLRRELSQSNLVGGERSGGWVIAPGRDGAGRKILVRASILGRISMNLTVVDVTGNEEVGAGTEVVLLGDGVTAEDHARLARTIPYEILCGVRER
jgi:alanine racemase